MAVKTSSQKSSLKKIIKGTRYAWFVLRAISGKEAKVKELIEAEIKNTELGNFVRQVLIPSEKYYADVKGKRVTKERNLYSGYVFIEAKQRYEAIVDDTLSEVAGTWNLVPEVLDLRNKTNVIDFLRGREKNAKPEALREIEVQRMLGVADELSESNQDGSATFLVGEKVEISDGPFKGFKGEIEEVNSDKRKLKVTVSIFGRTTPLELEYTQVAREE